MDESNSDKSEMKNVLVKEHEVPRRREKKDNQGGWIMGDTAQFMKSGVKEGVSRDLPRG